MPSFFFKMTVESFVRLLVHENPTALAVGVVRQNVTDIRSLKGQKRILSE